MSQVNSLTFDELIGKEFSIPQDVVYQDLDGEMVLLNIDSGQYFGIDKVGSHIWQLLERQLSVGEIVRTLLDEYDIQESVCQEQVAEFFQELDSNNLLIVK